MKSTILAIDDDPIILDIYQAILSDLYDVALAASGEEALGILKSNPNIDLILSDIMMPGMTGYEVCENIRANPAFSHMKVILVSAKSLVEERLQGYEIGADDYITKPFEEEELLAKIKVFLRLKTVEEINSLKGNLLALLSHETRTPLNGILGFAEILRVSPNLDQEEKDFIDQIIMSGQKLLQLSEKTMLLSELKSEHMELDKTQLDLHLLVDECQQTFYDIVEAKQLTFHVQCDAATADIIGDAKLLFAAFDMILDNAVKFARCESVVEVALHNVGDRVLVDIANEGERIHQSDHENIFGEFFVENINQHHHGHGLSLSLARRIAEVHDGTLSARNRDTGPVFTFDFPTG